MLPVFVTLGNTAIAAEVLKSNFDRIAILDIDVHHGNGTQNIFYDRSDVLTVSIHADPIRFYPFFWGYSNEIGENEGEDLISIFHYREEQKMGAI